MAKYSVYKKKTDKAYDTWGTAKKLAKRLKPYWLKLILVGIAAAVSTAMSVLGPVYLGNVIDAINVQVQNKLAGNAFEFREIATILIKAIAVYAVTSLMMYIQQYTMAGVAQNLVYTLRTDVNKKLSILPLRYYDSTTTGEVLSRVVSDLDNINKSLQNNLTQIITSVITVVGVLAMMIHLNVTMTIVSVSIVPSSALIALLIASRSKRWFRQQWDRNGELNGHIEEMYTGHNIIKIFSMEKNAISEFDDINNELYKVSFKAQFLSGIIMPFISFVNNVGYVIICVMGGLAVLKNTLSLGGITTFITYSKLFSQPFVDLAQIMNNLQSTLASAERVFNLLDEEPETSDEGNEVLTNPKGVIRFEHVDFCYTDDKPLMDDLNLEVNPGQLVAIVGPTGAGKTTIVNLLMRFYDVKGGRITLDGKDINTLTRDSLRSAFGMILQDIWLFKGTIRDNIAYGRLDATDEEIIAAAKMARAHHFISTLSDGYDTVLDENGTNISQGQRQLITIARAVLANPSILILDEATSSVDTRTEMQIQYAMADLMKNRTCFVIAHRLSTIRKADTILVIDNGEIVETGNHQELLAKKGFYYQLYNS
ncbi:MAG: ABC transporter ATP-binding protein/permease [Clostridiales bacterium]|nr:ABC transporter ATP-binding protein [Clostridia bacterium]MCR4563429.1 ABC transporter ATP-binding protein/permease [Clostridiales bacterium]